MPEELIPNDITEKQLKWGYWFVTHKVMLKKILIVVLIVVNVGLIGYSAYAFIADLLQGPERAAQLSELAANGLNPDLVKANAPKPLEVSNVQVLAPQGKYDLVTTLKNDNLNYAAHFTYRFTGTDFATDPAQGFVLPDQEKFLVELGVASPSRPANADIEITDINWQRIDKHVIPDWNDFANQHLNLLVKNTLYDPAVTLPDGKTIGKTTFDLTNDTGYGYYDVKAIVVMYRGAVIAGVNSTDFPTLAPGETKSGEVTWYEDFGAVSKIVVEPQIDILDNSVYLRAQ